jgi:hypothetical protein
MTGDAAGYGGGAVTPEQERLLDRMTKFLDTLTDTLGKAQGDPGPAKDKASPTGAAERIARTILEAEGAKNAKK